MGAHTEVVIVRHGESWTNLVGARSASESSLGLTRRGVEQAQKVAQLLAGDAENQGGFGVLYCSPRRRCLETATPIAEALRLKAVVVPELRSLDHGAGNPWDPAGNGVATLPPLAPRAAVLPGAETWEGYLRRAGRFLAELPRTRPGERILIIGHAETQSAAVTEFLRLPMNAGAWWRAQVDHSGLSRWAHDFQDLPGADSGGCWALVSHNDTGHLTGAATHVAPAAGQEA